MAGQILVVGTHQSLDALVSVLEGMGHAVGRCDAPADVGGHLERDRADLIVVDITDDGVAALPHDVPLLAVTRRPALDDALATLRRGAVDYIALPADPQLLEAAVVRVQLMRRLRDEAHQARRAGVRPLFEDIIGESPNMVRVFRMIERVAPSDSSVLIEGETGTGKELVARAIHQRSHRADGPYVAINCGALPETLLESELFGHVRGAFTDARVARRGLFLKATGGTLFLDEIGDMPRGLQVKLLRTLQERTIRPVGSDEEVPIDVRVLAATHQNLEAAVADGNFREDLYYRLAVISMSIPPLRERAADVVVLAHAFLERIAARSGRPAPSLSRKAGHRLMEYSWPGNVRELMNCVERAHALAEYDEITVEDLPDRVRQYKPEHVLVSADAPSALVTMDEVERRYIRRVLTATNGNRQRAAQILGFDRKTLYRKLQRYALDDS